MPALRTAVESLERPSQLVDLKAARRELADNLLEAARGDLPFEDPETAGELAAALLRRYDNRRATQGAYALDLADWTGSDRGDLKAACPATDYCCPR